MRTVKPLMLHSHKVFLRHPQPIYIAGVFLRGQNAIANKKGLRAEAVSLFYDYILVPTAGFELAT